MRKSRAFASLAGGRRDGCCQLTCQTGWPDPCIVRRRSITASVKVRIRLMPGCGRTISQSAGSRIRLPKPVGISDVDTPAQHFAAGGQRCLRRNTIIERRQSRQLGRPLHQGQAGRSGGAMKSLSPSRVSKRVIDFAIADLVEPRRSPAFEKVWPGLQPQTQIRP